MTPALHNDLRFRGAPLELRGLYRMLLDFEDAAGDVAARGLDATGAAAAALGCGRDEAAAALARMEAHGLLRVDGARVCLLVGSRRGKRGGASGAERARKCRAGRLAGSGGGSVASDVTPGNGQVTGEPRVITEESADRNGSPQNGARETHPSLPGSPSPPPAPSLSPSYSLPPRPVGDVAAVAATLPAEAAQGSLFAEPTPPAPAPKTAKPRPPGAPPPLPFKLAEAFTALADAAAGRFVPGEGRDVGQATAIAVTAQIRSYPTLAEWQVCGAWLAAGALAHRGVLGPAWVASAGFRDAMALARDWDAKGRPPVDRRDAVDGARSARNPPAHRRHVGPAPCGTAADFARAAAAPDPLAEILHRTS